MWRVGVILILRSRLTLEPGLGSVSTGVAIFECVYFTVYPNEYGGNRNDGSCFYYTISLSLKIMNLDFCPWIQVH